MKSKEAHDILSKHILKDVLPVTYDVERSRGNIFYDSLSKRALLDCFSFIASNPIGHNHPDLSDSEFEKKLLQVAKTNPSNSDIVTKEYASFVETFSRVAGVKELPNLFFCAGGSVAVENALKTAFDWKFRLNTQRDIHVNPNDLEVIHFTNAFHGRTGYTLSLTNSNDPRKYKFFPKFNWPRFNIPDISDQSNKKAVSILDFKTELAAYITEHKNNIASLIIEPIQGEGGDRHFDKQLHGFLREITEENDIILIYDEVQTGLGLTGKMWAFEHFDIIPDIVCFGKKVQVCGIMASNKIKEVKNSVFEECSRINSTWGGNLTDMVRCERYLEIIEKDKLVENAHLMGLIIKQRLDTLENVFPVLVSNSRNAGLMAAFDLPNKETRDKFVNSCLDNGVLLLGCGEKSVRLRPSLTFTEKEIDVLFTVFYQILSHTF